MDSMCSVCGSGHETIFHVLFHCDMAQSVWEQAHALCPLDGFSHSSVFLNLHHLVKCSQHMSIDKCWTQKKPS